MKEAIILAGGLGTRLQGVVNDVPKSMASINGRPFLEYQLDYLEKQGFTKVVLSVGYLSEIIIRHFGNRYQSIQIDYSVEPEPLGTGGAVKLSCAQTASGNVFVLNGDTLFQVDFDKMEQIHLQNHADVTLALREVPDAGRYGRVQMDEDGRITAFCEKQPGAGKGLINGGIYLLNTRLLENLQFPEKFSLERDCFEKITQTHRLQSIVSKGYFIDIGIPDDYQKAQTELPRLV